MPYGLSRAVLNIFIGPGKNPSFSIPVLKFALSSALKTILPPNVTGTIPAGQPMLLVRVLNVNSTKPVVPTIVELPNLANPKNYSPIRRLLIPADAVSPDFRVLLFAFQQGDALPQTTWNGDRTAVSVEAGGVKDRVEFIPGKSGKTSVAVVRAGKTLVQLDREVTPLN